MGLYTTQRGNFDYVFRYSPPTGLYSWSVSLCYDETQESMFNAPEILENITGESGVSTAISYQNGNLVLGNPDDQTVEVYLSSQAFNGAFEGEFSKVNRLSPYDYVGASGFGSSLRMLNNLVFIGAPLSLSPDSTQTGAGAVFFHSRIGTGGHGATGSNNWGQVGVFTGDTASGYFGTSLSASTSNVSQIIGIGATGEVSGSGAVHLYNSSSKSFVQKITPTGSDIERFGKSQAFVSQNGVSYIAIGYDQNDIGKVGIYKETEAGNNNYQSFQILSGENGAAGDLYGGSVFGFQGEFLVGAPNMGNSGQAYFYQFSNESGTFFKSQDLAPSNLATNDFFGKSVTFDTGFAIIGSNKNSGSAYVFNKQGGSWVEESHISGNEPSIDGAFAGNQNGSQSLVIDNRRIIAGTNGEKNSYVFTTGLVDVDDYTGLSFSGKDNKIYDSSGRFIYGYGPSESITISGGVFTGGYFSMYVNGNLCVSRSPREAGLGRTGALNDWSTSGLEDTLYYYLGIIN